MFAYLGDIKFGHSGIMTGPTADSETLDNTINEHKVVQGKPVPQDGGEELDKRDFSFFFDESFCDPQAEYAKLRLARSMRSPLALVMGNGLYLGISYTIKSVGITTQQTTEGGRIVRLDATISLVEVPFGGFGATATAIASIGRAVMNPFARKS